MNGLFASGLLFSESVIERLGWVLIHSLWQFALIGLLSVAALGVMRRKTSEARYAVLVGLMALLFVFPVATWMLQPNRSAVVSSASTAVQSQLESPYSGASALDNSIVDETNSDGPVVDASVDRPAALDPSSTSSDQEPASTISANSKARSVAARSQSTWIGQATAIMRPWLGWMVFCWGIGVMLCLLRPLLGWLTLRRLRRVGVWTASPEIRASLARVSEQMGLRQTVRVMESSLAHVPMVIGYLRPVILLPISLLTNIPATQLESILAHELAHIRRHDFIANLLQVLIETLFFYHPAVWWLSHRIRVEREHCCDDMVVKIIDDRTEYGRALIAIEELSGQSTVLSLGASDGSLLQRVRRISERPVDRSGVSAWTTFCLIASLVGFVFFLSLMEHGGVAAMDANNRNDDPQPLRSLDDDEFETAAHPASDELEFLAGHPKLKELTLEMTEQQFLAIVKRNDLNPKKTIVGGGSHYLIPADDDHRVIVMFGTGGDKCSGIQRVRADNRPSDITTLREPDGGDTSLKEEWKHGEIDSGTLEFEIVAGGQPANKSAAAIVENETIALADAVRDFNAENKQLDRGLDQPPLTEDEVIAAIKQSDRKRDAPKRVSEREFAAFKAVADSRRLPKDSYIKVWTTEEPTPLTVIHKWEVRLFMPAQDSDGFVNFRLRNKKRDEQQIDPNSIAWGPPDPDGLSLGLFLLPKKDVYKIGDRVRLRLFVRNDGSKAVEDMTFQNITWPGPKDFTVTDQTGKEIKVRNCHDEWSGAMWIAGAIGGGLSPSDVHSFRIPFELAIGGDKPNKLVGRVVEAKLGQSLQLKIRARNGSGRVRAEDEPVPESGNVTFKVAED